MSLATERTGQDPRTHALTRDLANCDSLDEILTLFDMTMGEFKEFRMGSKTWNKLRNTFVKPAIKVLLVLNSVMKDASDSFVRLCVSRPEI